MAIAFMIAALVITIVVAVALVALMRAGAGALALVIALMIALVAFMAGGGAFVDFVGQRRRHRAAMVRELAREGLLRRENAEQADRGGQQQRKRLHHRLPPGTRPPLSMADHLSGRITAPLNA
ncbi:MAG: hypothetical protein EOS32_20275 [Mesorhizobium sp.]|nr:MAG: hypothetical protein EOS32_20275 [Mesorhizobium sp.]